MSTRWGWLSPGYAYKLGVPLRGVTVWGVISGGLFSAHRTLHKTAWRSQILVVYLAFRFLFLIMALHGCQYRLATDGPDGLVSKLISDRRRILDFVTVTNRTLSGRAKTRDIERADSG